jgi:predicted ATPase
MTLLRERISDPKQFPYCLPAIRNLNELSFHPKVTFFVGENGSGKSTLLEAIAIHCGLNPEGGSRNFNFATRESHSRLDEALRLSKAPGHASDSFFLRAESYYNVATVQSWEQGKRVPSQAARRLIQIFAIEPEAICRVVGLPTVNFKGFVVKRISDGTLRLIHEVR